jgi:cysteine desulfurase
VTAYFDYNATAPVRPEAAAAVAAALREPGNPSSVHGHGRAARRTVEEARAAIAELIAAAPADLIFVSGGTEANALALAGCGRARVLAGATEHDSALAHAGADRLPVDADGLIDLAALRDRLGRDARDTVVALQLANNETGAIQPVRAAAEIAHAAGALLHCDAVQAAGKIAVDVAALGADYVGLSAHKLGGPQGIGALWARPGAPLASQRPGGGQERGRRAGTENVPGIAGFGAAARAAGRDLDGFAALARWRDRIAAAALAARPDAAIHAAAAPRLPNTLCLGLPGMAAETQVMALDLAGFAVSAGAACSSGKVARSHVLAAMGAGADAAGSAIRISMGWATTGREVEALIAAWTKMAARRRAA